MTAEDLIHILTDNFDIKDDILIHVVESGCSYTISIANIVEHKAYPNNPEHKVILLEADD